MVLGSPNAKVDRFKTEYDNLRRLTPEETRRIVTAVCEADDRRSVASDVHDRVASTVSRKYDDLAALKDDTSRRFDEVISDDVLRDRQSDARWSAFSSRKATGPHKDRQGSSSYCDVSEFSMSSGRADCVQASNCMVIELKPDNSRAISSGRSQAQRYRDELNNNADTRKKLIERNSSFAKCEKFTPRVDCYKLCPDIDQETNEYRSTSASWRTDC